MIPTAIVLLSLFSPLLAIALIATMLIAVNLRRRVVVLREEARHDPLTGLPNRRGLAAAWDAMPGEKALLLIDLVGFKAVNDAHGHVVGDRLLQQVSGRLVAAVSPHGALARWGGDEFAAIVRADRLEKQRELIAAAQTMPYLLPGPDGVDMHVRIGARFGEGHGKPTLDAAIAMADAGLMAAKGG